jgi:hypothetical protein
VRLELGLAFAWSHAVRQAKYVAWRFGYLLRTRYRPRVWPQELALNPEVTGVCVGYCGAVGKLLGILFGEWGCLRRSPKGKIVLAHAHNTGMICFADSASFLHRETVLHELAHVLTGQAHTETWQRKLDELGGRKSALSLAS